MGNLLKNLILFFCIFILQEVNAQDTIIVMQYNLLNYGYNTSYCDQSNNNIDIKNENIRVLLDYITPDIISVNEMVNDSYKAVYLLNNALNTDGRTFYKNAFMTNLSGSNLVNMLYYNSEKFTLARQEAIGTSVRDINVYYLYYNSPDLHQGDTVWLTCIVTHLKAGSYPSDESERASMTETMMNYVSNHNIDGNVVILGDMNLYSSSEAAYQNMVNFDEERFRVYDPISMSGDWSGNSYFSMIHTQSTHSTSDCFVGGGLDDRFDFILISEEIRDDLLKVKYVPSSYEVIGQDGQHFNSAIIDYPVNSIYPEELINALYNISDHLPVVVKLRINQSVANIDEGNIKNEIFVSTLVSDEIFVDLRNVYKIKFELYNTLGQKLKEGVEDGSFKMNVSSYESGVYFLKIDIGKKVKMFKIVKK